MEDRLTGVQAELERFRKKVDEIHNALNEQKQYDLGVKIDAMRAEMQGQIDRISRDVLELQGRAAGMGMSVSAPSPASPPSPAPAP